MLSFSMQLFAQKKSNNISLVLPFCSKKIIDNPNCYDAQLGNMCREYYQGALIALDSFERAHVPINLSLFDTENDSISLTKILLKPIFRESELIIGPVWQNENKMLANFAKEKGVMHVSPLMTFSKATYDDPNWISANPDVSGYASFLYKYILKQTHDTANIIVVSDKSSFDKNFTGAFKQNISASKTIKIKYIDFEKGIDIIKYLSTSMSNHIIIPSSNEPTLIGVFKNIKDTDDTFNMTTYGFPHWFEFKNPDFDVWQRMNASIITPYFVNYDDECVKKFIAAYRARFATEPTDAAFKGYDQMLLFGYALAVNGKNFISQMDGKTAQTLSTKYHLIRKQNEGSFQNDYLNVIKLEDLKMKKVN
jgi:ABC-type branched-subunit amino acid transport system substrate-binding protein